MCSDFKTVRWKNSPSGDSFTVTFGEQGDATAKYDLSEKRLMILEFTDTGNVMMTSIEAPIAPPVVAGIHTRHTWLGSKALISTMSGHCIVR
jgi:hypothetical protein